MWSSKEGLPWALRRNGQVDQADPVCLVTRALPDEEKHKQIKISNFWITFLSFMKTTDRVSWLDFSSPLVLRAQQYQVDQSSPLFLFGLGHPKRSH